MSIDKVDSEKVEKAVIFAMEDLLEGLNDDEKIGFKATMFATILNEMKGLFGQQRAMEVCLEKLGYTVINCPIETPETPDITKH